MKKQKELVDISEMRAKITEFYDPKIWHFVCISGLFENALLELQWSFTQIGENEAWKIFCASVNPDDTLPTLSDLLPTAKMYEGELKDLLGANFEGSVKGMFIETDGVLNPLRIKR